MLYLVKNSFFFLVKRNLRKLLVIIFLEFVKSITLCYFKCWRNCINANVNTERCNNKYATTNHNSTLKYMFVSTHLYYRIFKNNITPTTYTNILTWVVVERRKSQWKQTYRYHKTQESNWSDTLYYNTNIHFYDISLLLKTLLLPLLIVLWCSSSSVKSSPHCCSQY